MFFWNSCFFDDPADVDNLISGSSPFSKTSLNIWKFTVHVLLKPGLENFKHHFISMWDECNCAVEFEHSLALPFFGTGMKTDLFQSCGPCWDFQICWHIEHSAFTASSFRIWNSSTGIPSPPLALFVVMLSKACLTSHSRMSLLSSVQFSHSVVSDSLRPHESQHARPPCPSQTPGVYSNSCPLSWRCHPTISSSVVPFISCPQSLPASGSFSVSQLFTWGGQSTGVSASASVLPRNTQDWSPLGWTGCISLQSKGLSRVFSNTTV